MVVTSTMRNKYQMGVYNSHLAKHKVAVQPSNKCCPTVTLRSRLSKLGPYEIFPLSRNFFVIKYFPLTVMLNYLTYWVSYIEKIAAFEI